MDTRDWVFASVIMTLIGLLAVSLSAAPKVETVEVEVPGPTVTVEVPGPTVEVPVEVEVEVPLEACLNALDIAQTIMYADNEIILSILKAYSDYPDETLAEFGTRVEQILIDSSAQPNDGFDTYIEEVEECYNAASVKTTEEAQGA